MAQVKGKFITLSCSLLETKPNAKVAALNAVKTMTGKEFNELDQKDGMILKFFQAVFQAIEDNSSPLCSQELQSN